LSSSSFSVADMLNGTHEKIIKKHIKL